MSVWGSSGIRVVLAPAAACGAFAGLIACADALSIQPPAGGAGGDAAATTTTGVGGGDGGGAPVPCISNSDCPTPTTVCDAARGVCVECLELADCGHMPGTVCSQGTCVCPSTGESWCEPDRCVDFMSDPENCGQCDKPCFGACNAGACADAWEPVVTEGAPTARARHVAQWTGSVMFIWGGTTNTGAGANLNTGGMYDPATLEWTPTSLVDAPSPRQDATSVWTGSHVLVWGGRDGGIILDDGAMFDPATNTWTRMSTLAAPPARYNHTAVWTGTAMIVWGGLNDLGEQINSGGVFNPTSNSWTATAAVPIPAATRELHSAVWAGDEMWIYGGFGDSPALAIVNEYFPTGGVEGGLRYDPVANAWSALPVTSQPTARELHTAVYDGTNMIVFGGYNGTAENNLGHRVSAGAIQWEGLGGTPPVERREHTALWLDGAGVMVVWGGRNSITGVLGSGGVYTSSSNQWTATTPTALSPRVDHTAVSTGEAMIVWGGFDSGNVALADGGIYTP